MLVALDFDGTLAPIVPHPDDAALPADTRRAIERLAGRSDTRVAVISGRALADVRDRVGVESLYYAGNHGLEIEGPQLRRSHPVTGEAIEALRTCVDRLRPELAEMPGVLVEDKGLTLSVHYRMAPDARTVVENAVVRGCAEIAGLRVTHGKMVVEVRPELDWDKGRAARFLIDSLLTETAEAPVLFAGDDRTDEDAFLALAGRGDGIVVGDPPPADTAATFHLRGPHELPALLEGLAR